MSVPIQIDTVRAGLVRCTYLYIETIEPQPNWSLELGSLSIPILMVGMSAIVVNAPGNTSFNSPSDIAALFERVENLSGLSLETSDIWLPQTLFSANEMRRGAVYRITFQAFGRAFAQRRDGFDARIWADVNDVLQYSAWETKAFDLWDSQMIELAKAEFRRDHELKLQTRTRNNLPRLRPPPPPPRDPTDDFPRL